MLKFYHLKWTILFLVLFSFDSSNSLIKPVKTGGLVPIGKIEGIGYREPDL
jgi:hypothetical protein